MNLSNELTAIKILDPSTADDDGPGDRRPTRDHIRKAFDKYFLESRPLPVEFFKEECRAMLDEEFRERRKLLYVPPDGKFWMFFSSLYVTEIVNSEE